MIEQHKGEEQAIETVQKSILQVKEHFGREGELHDGYHSFDELYEFRLMYNALLFNEWAKSYYVKNSMMEAEWFEKKESFNVHKSWRHHDGEYCFGKEGEWFIVCAMLPDGMITNHYRAKHWDKFKIPETETAMFPFDGHTSQDVLLRMKGLI